MASPFRIALALDKDTAKQWTAWFVAAFEFAHTRKDWQICRVNGYANLSWETAIAAKPDGIIGAMQWDQRLTQKSVGRARVVILNTSAEHPFSSVATDQIEAGRRAAAYLLGRRMVHFAFVGWSTFHTSCLRCEGFKQGLADAKLVRSFEELDLMSGSAEAYAPSAEWLRALPKPCGLLCANDGLGTRVINACLAASVRVPEEIAVLGVDNDPIHCMQPSVTLSSVDVDDNAVGRLGAETMDRLLRSPSRQPLRILVPPGEVAERESTRSFGVPDPFVSQALTLIHEPDPDPMSVKRLMSLMRTISRRSLELRFKESIGRTLHQEIIESRVESAKQLLRNTNLKMSDVAFRAGFSDPQHFSRPFRKLVGQTPLAYRRTHQRPNLE